MNELSFSMPDGLTNVSHCRMAAHYEQWLTDPQCFHTVIPQAVAQLRRPYPESDAEISADCGGESQGWSVAVDDDGTDTFLDADGRSMSTASKWHRVNNSHFIPPTELLWARSLAIDQSRDQQIAMRAVLTRCSCPIGKPYSHKLQSNKSIPRPSTTKRCPTCSKKPPSSSARNYSWFEESEWDNLEVMRGRHSCVDQKCKDTDHPSLGYSGDICLLMQVFHHGVNWQNHNLGMLNQYMVSCTVESSTTGSILYQSVCFPNFMGTLTDCTTAHHVIDGSFARTCAEPVEIRLAIGRLQPEPVQALSNLSSVHFSHPVLTQKHVCEPDSQHRLMDLRGVDYPAHLRRALTPRIILFVSDGEPLMDTVNQLSSGLLHPTPSGRLVTAFHLYVLQYANPDFAQIIGYHTHQAAQSAQSNAAFISGCMSKSERLIIPTTHSRKVLLLVQGMMYEGKCAPCTRNDLPMDRNFQLYDLAELFHFCHQNRMMFWLSNFREFLEAAVCHYGLGAAAMSCSREEYKAVLEWLHKMQPEMSISSSVCLALCIYYRHRWADRSGRIDSVVVGYEGETGSSPVVNLTDMDGSIVGESYTPNSPVDEDYRPWLQDMLPVIPHHQVHIINTTASKNSTQIVPTAGKTVLATEPHRDRDCCVVCGKFLLRLRRSWFKSVDHFSCGETNNDHCQVCTSNVSFIM